MVHRRFQCICGESLVGGVDGVQGTTEEEHAKQVGGSRSASQRKVLKEEKKQLSRSSRVDI